LIANVTTSRSGLQKLGLIPGKFPRGVMYGVLGALAAIPLTIGMSALVQVILQQLERPTPQDHELIQIFRSAPTEVRRLVVLSATVLAPIFEETFFRGHVQTALAATFAALRAPQSADLTEPALRDPNGATRWLAIAVVSALFASVHGINWMFAPLYLLSLCLGYAYERTGNLWVPITMHASFNVLSLLMAMLSL
jgi:membrane protease YdiL (CAAX protease family)